MKKNVVEEEGRCKYARHQNIYCCLTGAAIHSHKYKLKLMMMMIIEIIIMIMVLEKIFMLCVVFPLFYRLCV